MSEDVENPKKNDIHAIQLYGFILNSLMLCSIFSMCYCFVLAFFNIYDHLVTSIRPSNQIECDWWIRIMHAIMIMTKIVDRRSNIKWLCMCVRIIQWSGISHIYLFILCVSFSFHSILWNWEKSHRIMT